MVHFKRKPVQYVPIPVLYEDQEIWVIKETDEIFTNYDDYLARLDYYKTKKFICEITGHSGMDFFTALRSEMEASTEVDDAFPDPLREPILRKVQHSIISRIDNLVDHVFEEFKHEFYPGETVTVLLDSGKHSGFIREKSRFPELLRRDGTVERKAFSRYFVGLAKKPDHEALVDGQHMIRDRKAFTKQMLRSFLKNSLYREAWAGAPWQVKERLAHEYRISTIIPPHLRHDAQVAQRKVSLNLKKGDYDGTILNFFGPQNKGLPELKPKGAKDKAWTQDATRMKDPQRAYPLPGHGTQPSGRPTNGDGIQFINQNPGAPHLARGPSKPPAIPIKYPREDLENPPNKTVRPSMKYLSQDTPDNGPSDGAGSGILMESVGPLLETWNTLNVYCEVFKLDSFTFDDYIEALQFTSEDVQSELVVEIHCAVLKILVKDEQDHNGQVQIRLPEGQDSSDEESSEPGSTEASPTPEPEVPVRTTRSSLAKSEAAEIRARAILDAKIHNGAELDQCVKGYGWKNRLRKRDLANGKWVVIVVGLLNLYSTIPRMQKDCERILAELAPVSMEAVEETAISQYASLDINLRVKILQFLCLLSLETKSIKNYMEECSLQMTEYRKSKMEQQRLRRQYLDDLKALEEERKALQPEKESPAPDAEATEKETEKETEDEEMKDAEEVDDTNMDSEDEDVLPQRSLRRATDRAAERKRKLDEERKRKERAEIEKAKKPTKEARQLEKLLRKTDNVRDKIKECEAQMADIDQDLRENDIPRTRVLGKDRFWNRYYWFERNAMPYAGIPTSSTADAGYANGSIWVQGPDDIERVGFIDLSDAENARYEAAFGVTVPARKIMEEGATHTFTAHQWGYYDDPNDLDKLIGWLNDKGVREIKLRKELSAHREQIAIRMIKRNECLTSPRDKSAEASEQVTRISTRTKTYSGPSGHRFMAWKNTWALRELGHLHSEPTKPHSRRGVARVISNPKKAPVEEEVRQTRGTANKHGKPLGRQGTRYNF